MLKNVDRRFFFCPGVYALYSEQHGKIYVGSSVNMYKRINFHIKYLQKNKHHNIYLQNFYNKYGEEYLEAIVLCRFPDISLKDLRKEEQKYIDIYFNQKYCFNLSKKAEYFCRTDEQKKEYGKFMAEFWDKNYETQVELARKNVKKATIAKKKLLAEGVYYKPWNKGKKITEETRKKLSEIAKNREVYHGVTVKVNMEDFHGNILQTFNSARDAARHVANNELLSSNILNVCRGNRSMACGYYWSFADKQKNNKNSKNRFTKEKDVFKAYKSKYNDNIIVRSKNAIIAKRLLREILTIEKGERILWCEVSPVRICSEDNWARSSTCLWKKI